MIRTNWMFAIAAASIGFGCAELDTPKESSGNAALGIATFELEETASETTIIGRDADGQEIGRLDLIHGPFASIEFPGEQLDGRMLGIAVKGQEFSWETNGYAPYLHMPAHARGSWMVGAFVADPHVKPVLDRWGIGWDASEDAADESAYSNSLRYGSSYTQCSGVSTCGSTLHGTINTCGGGAATLLGARITDTSHPYNGGQYSLTQCCPSGSGGQSNRWQAVKLCPLDNQDNVTDCGTLASGATCKGCGVNNATAFCGMIYNSSAGRVEANWGATYLSAGETCQYNGINYGVCEPGVSCLTASGGVCKTGYTCYCDGEPLP